MSIIAFFEHYCLPLETYPKALYAYLLNIRLCLIHTMRFANMDVIALKADTKNREEKMVETVLRAKYNLIPEFCFAFGIYQRIHIA